MTMTNLLGVEHHKYYPITLDKYKEHFDELVTVDNDIVNIEEKNDTYSNKDELNKILNVLGEFLKSLEKNTLQKELTSESFNIQFNKTFEEFVTFARTKKDQHTSYPNEGLPTNENYGYFISEYYYTKKGNNEDYEDDEDDDITKNTGLDITQKIIAILTILGALITFVKKISYKYNKKPNYKKPYSPTPNYKKPYSPTQHSSKSHYKKPHPSKPYSPKPYYKNKFKPSEYSQTQQKDVDFKKKQFKQSLYNPKKYPIHYKYMPELK
jgi:hypothetical protein